MLTVKHIGPTGNELVMEADLVKKRYTTNPENEIQKFVIDIVIYEKKRESWERPPVTITGGEIFVMNENGKTVATYHIGNATKKQ